MRTYLILLGGNEGNVRQSFTAAILHLREKCRVVRLSSLYVSEAWGFCSHDFLNQVVEVQTPLDPLELLDFTQHVERLLGRTQKTQSDGNYSARLIDIDLLLSDDLCVDTERLTLPHPRLHMRRFTLLPLCEHWAKNVHPKLNKTMDELLALCEDKSYVYLLPETEIADE